MKQWMMAAALAVATIGGVASGAGAAQAATYVSPGGTRGLTIASYGSVGQSFTMVGTQLQSFGFQLQTIQNATNGPLTFTLREGNSLTGTILKQISITPAAGALRANFWQDIDLTGTLLTDGAIYTAALTATSARLAVLYGPTSPSSTVDGYAGGRLVTTRALTNDCTAGRCDTSFRFTSASGGAVPEPATWALMLLGFGTIGHALRRRTPVQRTRQAA